uniref:Uncharacterized protein n=1 Tax=uncultured Flavobacteriia bacterium TaxID=212695 RepID=H6RF05_9BACT|nr:hypothetical protein VIS_S18BPA60014 [uncultured Flavobacteriia bacterium]
MMSFQRGIRTPCFTLCTTITPVPWAKKRQGESLVWTTERMSTCFLG